MKTTGDDFNIQANQLPRNISWLFLLYRKLVVKIQMYVGQDTLPHVLQFLTLSIKMESKDY